ncbi:MAG: hypothetical protein AAF439_14325, partial [Pseudomonadota bacterium]
FLDALNLSPNHTASLRSHRHPAECVITLVTFHPAFIVGDQVIRGYLPVNDMLAVVDQVRAASN